MSRVDEIAADVFRISTYDAQKGLQFNVFLVRDDEPLLYHTGQAPLFPEVRQAVASLIDPSHLRWIGFSHFESDECGSLNTWLDEVPGATALAGQVAAATCVNDYAHRPPKVMADGETLCTGQHTFEFLATPHLPHGWGASLLFDRTRKVLFCSDILLQRGNPEPLSDDILESAVEAMKKDQLGPFHDAIPYTTRTPALFKRLGALDPRVLAVMHGASFKGNGAQLLARFSQELARVNEAVVV